MNIISADVFSLATVINRIKSRIGEIWRNVGGFLKSQKFYE